MFERIAAELIALRVNSGKGLTKSAQAAGIDARRLLDAEEARVALDLDELAELADIYGVTVEAFFGGRTTPAADLK